MTQANWVRGISQSQITLTRLAPFGSDPFGFPAPPFKEQCEIVAALDLELAKFDTLTAEAQRAIDLLPERRTALIPAAVTGQIDVRGVCA